MLNKLSSAIRENGNAVGTFLGVSTPSIVEILGYTGMDFGVIDTEHGPYDTIMFKKTYQEMMEAIRG